MVGVHLRNNKGEDGRTCVAAITGATGAIGKAIALRLAEQQGSEVVLLCRKEEKARQAVQEIRRITGNGKVRHEIVDVSRRASILDLVERWRGPLHILVNNAAVTPRRREETPEGIELQFATNVLGYFWMTQAFVEHLKQSAPARVVNVASYWAGDLDLTDLEFKGRRYDNNEGYRQSKQANRMLTVAFAERLRPLGICVYTCHPGNVNSTLSNSLGFRGSESPDEGARTPVWLAIGPVGCKETGKYFEHMREVRCPFAEDRKAVEELYKTCVRYCAEKRIENYQCLTPAAHVEALQGRLDSCPGPIEGGLFPAYDPPISPGGARPGGGPNS